MSGQQFHSRSFLFRRDRERSWRRLERLVELAEKRGLASLAEDQLMELPALHRAAVSALSVARAISLDAALLAYLESLTARSHACVYGLRGSIWHAFVGFFTKTFPSTVHDAWRFVAMSGVVFLLGTLTAFAVTSQHPELYDAFVSPDVADGRDPTASDETLREPLYARVDVMDALVSFSSFLFTHNTQIGFLCFALGFAFGIPVLWLLFVNGMLLGGMLALYQMRGLAFEFCGWILPHGITEIGAIVLCGAAGLMQGHAVLLPGTLSRADALRSVGRRASAIVMGSVALFALAALIEGFFRQLVHSDFVRYLVASATAVWWGWYFVILGGSRR